MTAEACSPSRSDERLRAFWQRAWVGLQLTPPPSVLERLIQSYDEPQRHYHTRQHLIECLTHFDAVCDQADQPGALAIALWFHDAVYDVRARDNEQRSADWAVQTLGAAQASPATQQRVHQLIMATRHDAIPTDDDTCLLVDIDLAILGAEPPRFAEYDQQVRREYGWVPSWMYAPKRRAVLRSFLARPHIYSTAMFRERFEAQARTNLASALS